MTDLRWHDAVAVEFQPFKVDEQGFGKSPEPMKVAAVALAGPWLFVDPQAGAIQIIPAHRVARVRLADGSVRAKTT